MSFDLESARAFLKVADLGSFTGAGAHLGLSKSRVSTMVAALEGELRCQLLQRSTRAVRLTPDGELFAERARQLVADAEEIAALFQGPRSAQGRVRIDLPVGLARNAVLPRLPDLLAAHPRLELEISTTDRRVDVMRDGFDCVLRVGTLEDSGLTARRIGALTLVNCASPGYLVAHGTPTSLEDLSAHWLVHYSVRFGTDAPSFEYVEGGAVRSIPMRSRVTVNASDAYLETCVAGLGIIQAPRIGMRSALSSGNLVEVLPAWRAAPMPVSLVHGYGRSLPGRVKVVMAWLAHVLAPQLV